MWPNPPFSADLVTFTEEVLNGNFIFCAVLKMLFGLIPNFVFSKIIEDWEYLR